MLSRAYQVLDTVHENSSTVVYRAQRLADGQNVIIKMLKPKEITQTRMAQFMNEQHILSLLRSKRICRLLDVVAVPSEYAHIFEDIGGESLYDLIFTHPFTLLEKLKIALDIAEAVAYIHKKHIIHLDVNPKNIVYNPQTKTLQLIDFGFSIIDQYVHYNSDSDVGTSGNLMYMSPEQTGRTKQKIDYRSDFYSFGMTLYHLFSGQPPFDAKDRYELVHKQIALSPKPLEAVVAHFPAVLSAIVTKLIAKDPMQRYQCDDALIYDLKQCLVALTSKNELPDFELGSRDQPILDFSQLLIGREHELSLLDDAVKSLHAGKPVRIVASGASGVGKTRLIEAFISHLDGTRTTVLRGKFEQYKATHPYLTLKQLLGQLKPLLLRQGLLQRPLEIEPHALWALRHVFEELRSVLPAPTSHHASDDVHVYMPYALDALFSQIATKSTPLLIFLDDMQWADTATLDVLEKLFVIMKSPSIHWAFSYRHGVIDQNPQAKSFIEKILHHPQVTPVVLTLNNLNRQDIQELLSTLLHTAPKKIEPLAQVIFKKTDGNPFYLKTFVENLIETKELFFADGTWQFHIETIQNYDANINIAAIIGTRFERLLPDERATLQILGLLGTRFDLPLTQALIKSFGLDVALLDALESKGFIEMYAHNYMFTHDLLLYHAMESMHAHEKAQKHWIIGLFLERAYRSGRYFDIVGVVTHLNAGMESHTRHPRLAKLNFQALKEMLSLNSYAQARDHLNFMIEHGIETALLAHAKKIVFEYGMLKTKTLYLNGAHNLAQTYLETLIEGTQHFSERIVYFGLFKDICVTRGTGFEALAAFGEEILSQLHLAMPDRPDAAVAALRAEIETDKTTQSVERIVGHKTLRNTQVSHVIALLVNYWEAVYYLADLPRMQWSFFQILRLSLSYGNTSGTAFGYVLYGGDLISQGRYEEGYKFGQAALKLLQKFPDDTMIPKIYNFMANFISPYTKGILKNVPLYETSLKQSIINGDIVFGTWANFLMHFSNYLGGMSLDTLRKALEEKSSWLLNSADQKMIAMFKVLQGHVTHLQESNEQQASIEASAVALWNQESFYPGLAWYAVIKAQEAYIQGEIEAGVELLATQVHSEANEVIMFPKRRLHTVRALLLLSLAERTQAQDAQLEADMALCRDFAKAAPATYKFWYALLQALEKKEHQNYWDAGKSFDAVIKTARKEANPFGIALAAIAAGRFWQSKGFDDVSRFYFSEASIGLNQWGAYEAATTLKIQDRVAPVSPQVPQESIDTNSSSSLLSHFGSNYRTLLKSFYALSQSLSKGELLKTLMQTILERATASRAVLVLKEEETFWVNASIDFATSQMQLDRIKLQDATFVPFGFISHAIEHERKIVAHEPAHSGKFQHDAYFRLHKPASAVAIPASIDGTILGVLYLENAAIATPLSGDTLQTLRLLLTQTVIIFKNILLLESLQKSDARLNDAQEISKTGSWQYDPALDILTWSAQTYRIYEIEPFTFEPRHEWVMQRVLFEDRSIMEHAQEQLLTHGHPCDIVVRITTTQNRQRTVRYLAKTVRTGGHTSYAGTIQDITDAKKSEATITKLSQVVSQLPLAVIITDPQGIIEYVNNHTLHMTGYFDHELLGHTMQVLNSGVHTDAFFDELWTTVSQKRAFWRNTIVNRMKNGALRDCASTIFPIINEHDEITHFVSIQDDITERNAKDKLFLMQTRQAQMGEMLSMIAHQWRQPLAIISAIMSRQKIKILMENATIAEIDDAFNEIEIQVQHLSRTITDFKDFFKPNKEKVQTTSSAIILKALELIEHHLLDHNIAVEKRFDHDAPYMTYESELVQVLLNLIKNAQDAFVENSIKHPRLRITSDQKGNMVEIVIEDNAGGIAPQVMDTLFSPYVSTKSENGTGLGLYMTKTIIEEHCKGLARVENIAGGARFILTFPISPKGVS